MKHLKISIPLLTISLFSQIIFYGYNIIMGRHYGGAAVDNSFISFTLLVDIIPFACFISYLFSNTSKKRVLPILIVLLAYLFFLLLEGGLRYTTVKAYIAFSIPAALTGIIVAKNHAESLFTKWLEPLVIFLSWVGISSMPVIMSASILEAGSEGIGIQSLSYYCAFAFSLNLFFLLFGDEISERFRYAQLTVFKLFSVALLVVQVVVTLSSGGRGGFVLLVVSSVVLVLIRLFTRKNSNRRTRILPLFLILAITSFIAIHYMPNKLERVVEEGSQRTFSYINKGGIDMGETSNRDIVYGNAIKDIKERPIFGYGLLMKGSHIEGSWPHNIILEILLQGGIVYLILFIIISISILKKLYKMIKKGYALFIIPLFLYPVIMLCFSGSYLSTGLFWFSLTYILSYDIPQKNQARIRA